MCNNNVNAAALLAYTQQRDHNTDNESEALEVIKSIAVQLHDLIADYYGDSESAQVWEEHFLEEQMKVFEKHKRKNAAVLAQLALKL